MKYGRALDRLIREVVIADPTLGPIQAMDTDVTNGFYHIALQPADAPNIGLVFPSDGKGE